MDNKEIVALMKDVEPHTEKWNELSLQLFNQNKPLISKWARSWSNFIEEADVIQEAYLIIGQAVESYDIQSDLSFVKYWKWCLRSSLRCYERNSQNCASSVIELRKRIEKIKNDYLLSGQELPSVEELAKILKEPLKKIQFAIAFVRPSSLDAEVGADEEQGSLIDTISAADCTEEEAVENVAKAELRAEMHKAISQLPLPEGEIITRHYLKGESITAIAKDKRRSISGVSARENKALKILSSNKMLQEFAKLECLIYKGSSFNYTGTSVVENYVIKKMELETEIDKLINKYKQKQAK